VGEIRVGTASWTDSTLLESGWYPSQASTPEERLKFYASRFPVVEVDSTYYSLPSERNSALWVERTPKDFTFDVKAFSLMTGHPVLLRGLPKDIRESLEAKGPRVSAKDIPPDSADRVWEMFREALMPLHSAGKLGLVMFQYPQWFMPSRANRERIVEARDRFPDYRIAVEFRQGTWFKDEEYTKKTLDFLRAEDIPFVAVDMPQGFGTSVPPIAEATSERYSAVRFHGRRAETWTKKNIHPTERFRYDYSEEELGEWVPRVQHLAEETRETHALFNNCYRDQAVRNAATFAQLVVPEE
jgi:uncharacterized protein YecE (DUF72 family)